MNQAVRPGAGAHGDRRTKRRRTRGASARDEVQRIDWVCPKHPNRIAILDICPGCMEEEFGLLEEDDERGVPS